MKAPIPYQGGWKEPFPEHSELSAAPEGKGGKGKTGKKGKGKGKSKGKSTGKRKTSLFQRLLVPVLVKNQPEYLNSQAQFRSI